MQDIEHILKTRIKNDDTNTFVVIVPNDAARLKRQQELIAYHPHRAVTNLSVHDIENVVQRLYRQVRPARRQISPGLQTLWLHDIANPQPDNADAARHEAFRPGPNTPVPDSTLSLIVDTINHLRERGETAQGIIGNNQTQTALADIYSDYEAKLRELWIDEPGKHLHLANNFSPTFMRNAFPRVNLVVVEGFTVLSQADIKILTRIAEMPNIEMWFRTDCVKENEALYKNITALVQQFRSVNACIDTTYQREPERHQHVAENLFRADAVPDADTAAQIKVLKPADRSEEVEQIAHLIQKHVSDPDGNCTLGDICVVYYNLGEYQQRIAEIFPAYGIPYSSIERVPLTQSEVVKAIFSRLSSSQVSQSRNEPYFSDVESVSDTHLFHPDAFQEYVDNLLTQGEVIRHILNPMLGSFEAQGQDIVEGEVEAYRQFKRIVNELCSVLRAEGEESHFLDDYIKKLRYIAKHTNYQNSAATKRDTVKIAQLGELRSLAFDTVFLGDFVEGRFPENYRPDPLLPDTPYRTEAEQLHDNRFMFYRVLKSFRRHLYLLVPQREGEADLIPSPFLEQLKAVADVKEIKTADSVHGSVPGFLSAYGNYVWTTDTPSDEKFPDKLASIRPLIAHVVKVEKSRKETHEHLAYEGVLTAETLSDKSRERLERRRQWTYSVTELETYAKCPFQYFANKVLKLRVTEDEPEDELSHLQRGSLLHEVLFKFYHNRKEKAEPPIGQCSVDAFQAAKAQLDEVLNSTSAISERNLFWETEIEKLRVALHKWLEAERTYDVPVTPRYFEVTFGQEREPRDAELSCSRPIRIGDVQMTGTIDRIDIANGTFNIIDYKTGSTTVRMHEILNGRSLQLPIYLQIAKKLLEANSRTELEPAAGLYHKIRLDGCTIELGIGAESQNGVAYNAYNGKDWKKVSRSGQLLEDTLFKKRLVRVNGYVQQYVDSISRGNFPLITRVETFVASEEEGDQPLTPRNKTQPCNFCAYKRACRVGAISETSQSND